MRRYPRNLGIFLTSYCFFFILQAVHHQMYDIQQSRFLISWEIYINVHESDMEPGIYQLKNMMLD